MGFSSLCPAITTRRREDLKLPFQPALARRHLFGIIAALIACASLQSVRKGQAAEEAADGIRNFLVMNLCTDEKGKVLAGVAPGDAACLHQRNVHPGEALTYHLHDYPSTKARGCKYRLGTLSKDNIPVVIDGVERIVSFYDRGVDHSCPDAAQDDPVFGQFDGSGLEGGSVQYFDRDFGFIMGSWSRVSLSYWLTPQCRESREVSGRFRRGWVIGPSRLPQRGAAPDWGTFQSKIFNGHPAEAAFSACPDKFNRQWTTWIRSSFTYKSGKSFDTLVSDHYSRTARDGLTPGRSQQMERTYWTDEFGLTRWEKWARADWHHPRNGKSAPELARRLHESGTCSSPYVARGQITPSLASEALAENGAYSMVLTDGSGERSLWYMTLCRDYTNIIREKGAGRVPPWRQHIPDIYWK